MSMRSWLRNLFARPATRPIRKAPHRRRLALEALEDRWCPSTVTVLTNGDATGGTLTPTGPDTYTAPTLRAAIAGANALAGADTITFDPTVFATHQTITLGGSQLELSDTSGATTITGPAAGVTVSGGGLSRVFQVDNLVTASISGLTISGGNAGFFGSGGGLLNSGTATLTKCTISGNSAGYGGGLYTRSGGAATLTNCTISGNSAGSGGGLLNSGTATLTNCTISGNAGYYSGGGLFNNGTATLTGCTISGNSATG
jgi:hypothetical protein